MDAIAVIDGRTVIYWNGIVLTLAACVAACFFLSFYLGRGGSVAAGFAAIPTAMVLSLVCARFFHWYSRADSYSGFLDAMTNYRSGGYALTGVFLGCVLTALLLRLIRLHRNTPMMLDCMSMAGAAGIAVGRLASLFNSSDRGQILSSLKSLPFAWPVTNAVSGQTEYRLATFMIQSMVAAGLFAALTVYDRRTRRRRDGDICLIFLMCYGASQVVLDSTRYDSLFFRSNGFVSVVQVLGALAVVLAIVVFSRRLIRTRGFRFWCVPVWLLMAALIGGAGYMEYYVQRRGNEAVFAYSVMSACLAAVVGLTLLVRWLATPRTETAEEP